MSDTPSDVDDALEVEEPSPRVRQTKAKLVDALITLWGERPLGDVSVRAIAEHAGVNNGLVHRYFGSKEGLVRETAVEVNDRFLRAREDRALMARELELLRDDPALARIVARVCLDGPHETLAQAAPPAEEFPEVIERLDSMLKTFGLNDAVAPEVVNALGISALLGWTIFRPLLDAGFGLPEDADDQVIALARFIDSIVSPPK